jgi:N utilization substance protein A
MRVQAVVQELRGEKIDIIQWTDDPVQFVRNALSPAKVSRLYVQEAEKTMQVVVANDQLSLAIGKRGQNVRLAAKLTHWKIDIKQEGTDESDRERLEALRRAESAFHIPKRPSTEFVTASEELSAPLVTSADATLEVSPPASVPSALLQSATPADAEPEPGLDPCDPAQAVHVSSENHDKYQPTES